MSVELNTLAGGRIVEVSVTGKLTKEDYEHFVPELEKQIEQHGRVRMLFDMHDFHGWDMAALWEDTKFGMRHYSDIERLAIIGEKLWQKWMTTFCKPFTKAEVEYFGLEEIKDAYEWLEEALTVEAQ